MLLMYIQALTAIGLSLSVLMMLAWVVQQRSGNSGWVDTIWTYSVGLVGAIAAVWPLGRGLPARQALVAGLVLLWSVRLGTHIARRALKGVDDPRYAHYAEEWGAAAPRRARIGRGLADAGLCRERNCARGNRWRSGSR
jgi:steroid 5-alpha reductase family enzyme